MNIETTGNATDFGNLSAGRYGAGGVSSTTRAVFINGNTGSASNVMDFVTIATRGNAIDFGDMTKSLSNPQMASDCIRGVRMGGQGSSIDGEMAYINIASRGDAVKFGDMTFTHLEGAGCSNAHGGL